MTFQAIVSGENGSDLHEVRGVVGCKLAVSSRKQPRCSSQASAKCELLAPTATTKTSWTIGNMSKLLERPNTISLISYYLSTYFLATYLLTWVPPRKGTELYLATF